jgi:hypothetical protein
MALSDTKEHTFPISEYSDMAPHKPGEGGALNANYTLVDAACQVTYDFARKGLEYGKDFRFDGGGRTVFGFDGVMFKFHDDDSRFLGIVEHIKKENK